MREMSITTKDTKDSEIDIFEFLNFVLFVTFVVQCLFDFGGSHAMTHAGKEG
jgi:hypothetical protein